MASVPVVDIQAIGLNKKTVTLNDYKGKKARNF